MATIRQRGPYRWEVQVRKRGSTSTSRVFRTKVDAVAWGNTLESEISRGGLIDRSEANRNTLDDLLERYLREVTPLKKGAEDERYRIQRLRRDGLSRIKASGLSGQLMAAWRDKRLASVSGSTTNRDLNLISHVINVARKEWGVHIGNPVAEIRRPQQNRARERRLAVGEEAVLLSAMEPKGREANGQLADGQRNPWLRPLVILALETAMRRSELLSLRWEDVFLEQRFVRLRDSKNGCCRDIPLSTRAVSILRELPREDSSRVFPISKDAVKKSFTRAVARANVKDLHFHDLRHEATSRLAEKLSNVLELSSVTGHKSLSMLQRYYHPRASELALKLG